MTHVLTALLLAASMISVAGFANAAMVPNGASLNGASTVAVAIVGVELKRR